MSDHSAATRRYAFLTPGSSAASARRSHSRALTLCSCTLDGISSDLRKHSLPIALNPWQADWFHSCDGENVACANRRWLRAARKQANAQGWKRESITRYSVWTATQFGPPAPPDVASSRTAPSQRSLPRECRAMAQDRRDRAGRWPVFFELSCLFQLLSHREMLLEMGQSARRPLLQVGVVSIFGIGFK